MELNNHEHYMLQDVPQEFYQEVLDSSQRLENASERLVEAQVEYMAAIIARIKLVERVRRGTN